MQNDIVTVHTGVASVTDPMPSKAARVPGVSIRRESELKGEQRPGDCVGRCSQARALACQAGRESGETSETSDIAPGLTGIVCSAMGVGTTGNKSRALLPRTPLPPELTTGAA